MTTWRDAAACQGVDPELFFSTAGPNPAAIRICRNCPVIADCLADALDEPWIVGVWGGTTEADRRRIHRNRAEPVPARAVRYTAEQRAAAVALYREKRPLYANNSNCAIAVAKHLGYPDWNTIKHWIAEDDRAKATAGA